MINIEIQLFRFNLIDHDNSNYINLDLIINYLHKQDIYLIIKWKNQDQSI